MSNKHHEIDLQGLQEWLSEKEVVFASSTRERKKLICTLKGNLKVYINDILVWQGTQPYSAVEAYNSIEDEYTPTPKNYKPHHK